MKRTFFFVVALSLVFFASCEKDKIADLMKENICL